jgi:hypothetical protein
MVVMSENLIFFYTGAIFWAIFAVAFLVSLFCGAVFGYSLFYRRYKQWLSFKLIEKLGVKKEWFNPRLNLLQVYDKKQRLLISYFLERVNSELKSSDEMSHITEDENELIQFCMNKVLQSIADEFDKDEEMTPTELVYFRKRQKECVDFLGKLREM